MITRLSPSETENRLYFEKACDGVRVKICCGASESGPLQATNHPDFIHVLDGCLCVECMDRPEQVFTAGETLVIPKGVICRTTASEAARFYVMSFTDPQSPADPVAGVIRLDPTSPTTEISVADRSQFLGAVPRHFKKPVYNSPCGRFLVAKWESDAFERAPAPFNRHELMIFLGGRVTLSDGASLSKDFSTGHIAFVPHHALYKWASTEFVSKFYCIVMPAKQ